MQINKIISSAKIVTITDLQKGNVVKFIDTQYSEEKLKFAIVMDVLRDAENVYVSLITFDMGYSGVEIKTKILSGNKNFALFPATPEEIKANFAKIDESLLKVIEQKRKEVATLQADYEMATNFMAGAIVPELSEPQYTLIDNQPAF